MGLKPFLSGLAHKFNLAHQRQCLSASSCKRKCSTLSLPLSLPQMKLQLSSSLIMFSALSMQRSAAFVARQAFRPQQTRAISSTLLRYAEEGQAEVVLVGCGAPNRGMGWYHAVQMLEKK